MNERLITDLLTAYRDCPLDAERLRRQRVVLADALEEAEDVRADVVRAFTFTKCNKPHKHVLPFNVQPDEIKTLPFKTGYADRWFATELGAEEEIRRRILSVMWLPVDAWGWQEVPVKSVSTIGPFTIGNGARLFVKPR